MVKLKSSYLVDVRLHSFEGDGEQGRAHVGLHELVVERHDLDQALQRGNFHLNVGRLRRFADDLHYEVTLGLEMNEKHFL